MTPLEFLAAVLPSSGRYCAWESKTKRHKFTTEVEKLVEIAQGMNAVEGANAYFWPASTDDTTAKTRKAIYATRVKSLWLDVDVGKAGEQCYGSKKEALAAIDTFLEETALGDLGLPFINTSGNGFQLFWPLDTDTLIADWLPVAEDLKLLCHQQGLLIDPTCTADAARVMRMPDTINYGKDGTLRKQARVLAAASTMFSLETLRDHIASRIKRATPPALKVEAEVLSLPGKRPVSASAVKMFENNITLFKSIINKTKEGTGCKQLAYYVENAEDDGMEPLWRGMLSIAQKCEDGAKAALWLSKLHPYDTDRMAQKLREIKGPYPCLKLNTLNLGVCDSCQHFGKITNPLALGRELDVSTEAKTIEVTVVPTEDDEVPQTQTVDRPPAPRGFAYGANGAVYKESDEKDDTGKKIKKQVMVLPFSMFVVNVLKHENEHMIHLLALRPEGAVEVTLPQRAVVSRDETVKHLAQQNIIASHGAGNDKNLFDFVRGCVEEASLAQRAVKVPDHYAWQPDDTFVFNERIISKTGTRHLPMRGLVNLNKACIPTGSIENWRKAINVLCAKEMHEILAMTLVGFGAPLMRFTGYNGITFHLGSSESGTGKTLALEIAASIWGHPTKFRVGKNTSDVAMQQRLGMLHSLPLISDEITAKNRKDFEWIPAFIFDVSEGQGKERMEAGANRERENTTYWSSMALLSSNTHVTDYMTGARKHSSEGELRRMLELTLNNVISWDAGDTDLINLIKTNFGVAGQMYAEFLVNNIDLVRETVSKVHKKLKEEFGFTDDERYWHAGCTGLVAGGVLASKAGIMDFPLKGIIKVLKRMVYDSRLMIRANIRTGEDVLNAYIRENYGKFVVVRVMEGAMAATVGDNGVIDMSLTRSEILGRVEHGVTPGCVDFYIEEQLLKRFCSSMSFGYTDFRKQMENMYHTTYQKKDLMSKTKGPQMRVNAMKISRKIDDESLDDQVSLAVA